MNALGWPFTSICTASCCHTGTLRSVNPGFAFVVACSNCHNTDPLQKTKNGKSRLPKMRMVMIHYTNIWNFWPQQMEIFLLFVISVKAWGNFQLDSVGWLIEDYDDFGGVGHGVFCLFIESRLESTNDGTSTFYSFSHFWWLSELHKTQFISIIH